jgi:hypothetical protein
LEVLVVLFFIQAVKTNSVFIVFYVIQRSTPYNLKINAKNRLHFSLTSISNVAISELRFTTTAVLFKHLIIAAGIGQDYQLNYTGTLGYRTNYFTIQSGYTKWGNYNGGNIFSSISVNLRDKEKRKELTNLETW